MNMFHECLFELWLRSISAKKKKKNSPKDLKTSAAANFPSKKTVLLSVLKKRLILTRTTSIEPGVSGRRKHGWLRDRRRDLGDTLDWSVTVNLPVFRREIWSF